jgi:hypothetical protein
MAEAGVSIGFCNCGPAELAVWLEPWAEEFLVAPRGEITLRVVGETVELPEVEATSEGVTVYAAFGSRIVVLVDGTEQDSASASISVPDLGPFNMRGFVDTVFGEFPEARPHGRPHRVSWFRRLVRRLLY